MADFAEIYTIRKKLLSFLSPTDWVFSFQLLSKMQNCLNGKDLRTLLELLKLYESGSDLTISERLNLGGDSSGFTGSLADFLNLNPEIGRKVLTHYVTEIVNGKPAMQTKLEAEFEQLPIELKELVSDTNPDSSTTARPGPMLLYAITVLDRIEENGCSCFKSITHRTRKYSGFFRSLITTIVTRIISSDPELQQTGTLPILEDYIDFMRHRSHFDELRQKILQHIKTITQKSRELKVFYNAANDRDLMIIKVKHVSLN